LAEDVPKVFLIRGRLVSVDELDRAPGAVEGRLDDLGHAPEALLRGGLHPAPAVEEAGQAAGLLAGRCEHVLILDEQAPRAVLDDLQDGQHVELPAQEPGGLEIDAIPHCRRQAELLPRPGALPGVTHEDQVRHAVRPQGLPKRQGDAQQGLLPEPHVAPATHLVHQLQGVGTHLWLLGELP
jgi:hypothetical protein